MSHPSYNLVTHCCLLQKLTKQYHNFRIREGYKQARILLINQSNSQATCWCFNHCFNLCGLYNTIVLFPHRLSIHHHRAALSCHPCLAARRRTLTVIVIVAWLALCHLYHEAIFFLCTGTGCHGDTEVVEGVAMHNCVQDVKQKYKRREIVINFGFLFHYNILYDQLLDSIFVYHFVLYYTCIISTPVLSKSCYNFHDYPCITYHFENMPDHSLLQTRGC